MDVSVVPVLSRIVAEEISSSTALHVIVFEGAVTSRSITTFPANLNVLRHGVRSTR